LQTDADIAAGQAARRSGRYDLAVAAFRRAAARPERAVAARELEFSALREVGIARHLIGRLMRRIGAPLPAYEGFAAIDPPLDAHAVRRRLDELASDVPFKTLLDADRLARGEAGEEAPAAGDATAGPEVRVVWAQRELRRGRPLDALARLSGVVSDEAPSATGQAVVGRCLWEIGDKGAAMNAFNLSLLYLNSTAVRGRLRFQTAYKDHRIVYYRGQFYAIPDWRDPIFEDSGDEAKVVAHRLPRWLRHRLRRILPSRAIDLMHRALNLLALRGEVRLDQMVHSPDLLSVLRAVDRLHPPKR
jgi:hypothetical protein